MSISRRPLITVDGVVLVDEEGIVLVKRLNEPFKDFWALPGGFVEYGETTEEAVKREVKEETGLEVEVLKLIGVYSDINRDPRGHVVSICYLCRGVGGFLKASSDAGDVAVFHLSELKSLKLAFDHRKILIDAEILRR